MRLVIFYGSPLGSAAALTRLPDIVEATADTFPHSVGEAPLGWPLTKGGGGQPLRLVNECERTRTDRRECKHMSNF